MSLMADAAPHSDFESRLAAKGYKPYGWVDVIDACDFKDRKTGKKVQLDRSRLQKIADKRNSLVVERQSVAHFCLGHTKDDAPEWEQPPVTGVGTRWRVGQYDDGTPNLEVYSWEKPGHEGVFDKYPQRSAELWLDPDDINPIALLSSTTPRRDLSLRLSKFEFDGEGEKTSTGSIVRFCRYDDGTRQPILFSTVPRPKRGEPKKSTEELNWPQLKEGGADKKCEECGKDLKSEPLHVVYPKGGRHFCVKCNFDAMRPQGPEKQSRGRDMPMDKAVKCDEDEKPDSEAPPVESDAISKADEDTANTTQSKDFSDLSAKVDKLTAMMAKFEPILDIMQQEMEAEAGGMPGEQPPGAPPAGAPPGGSPTAGPPPGPDGAPPGGPPAAGPDAGAPPPSGKGGEDDEEPPTRNSAGSAGGYGNTFMPNYPDRHARGFGYGADPETALRLQRMEHEHEEVRRKNAELTRALEDGNKQIAALQLQRREDEVNKDLDAFEAEGYVTDRAYDFDKLVRLAKAERAKELDHMKKVRAKKERPLPNGGQKVLGDADIELPVALKMARPEAGISMAGDPGLKSVTADMNYDDLVRAAGSARLRREPVKTIFAAPAANGTAVR